MENPKIVIIGGGVWGETLGYLLTNNNYLYHIWSRNSDQDLPTLVRDADVIISAVSMQGVKPISQLLQLSIIPNHTIIVSATKGLDNESICTPSQIWQGNLPNHSIVVLCGPNLSKEIKYGLPAATVVSSHNQEALFLIQEMFASDTFRVYANNDPIGTELGGTLKNVMAIAAGVCDGLNLGKNAKAALLTRALPEMIRVGECLGACKETFFGLSGLGDLLATCDGHLSRNYQVGYGLSQGKSLQEILSSLEGTAEGINTTNVLVKLANKYQIPIPISHEVYKLLSGKITPKEAVKNLMARELKEEFLPMDI